MFVARDKNGDIALFLNKPIRCYGDSWWDDEADRFFELGKDMFPELTWEDEPIEVEIVKKTTAIYMS